jgi:hypothetical protein
MTAPVYPAAHLYAGIAKEATYGVPVVPAYTVPVLSMGAVDTHTPLADQAWRALPVDAFGHVPGPLEGAVTLGGNAHPDTIGYPIAGVLGDVASAGAAPTTWTAALLTTGTQQPPSYTITTVDPIGALAWPGAKFTSLALSATAAGTLQWAASASSLDAVSVATPAAAPTAIGMLAAWRGTVQLGGVQVYALASSLTITRAVAAKRTVDGTRQPYLQRAGTISVAGQLQLLLPSADTYRGLYAAGTSTSIDLNYAQGAGAAAVQVRAHCSQVTLTDVHRDYASGKYLQLSVSFVADANTTDAGASGGQSPVKVTLQNAVPAGTYA